MHAATRRLSYRRELAVTRSNETHEYTHLLPNTQNVRPVGTSLERDIIGLLERVENGVIESETEDLNLCIDPFPIAQHRATADST